MLKRFQILVITLLIVAFAAPAAFASTFYNTMGYNLHYDDWGNPLGGTTLQFGTNGEPNGFAVEAGPTEEAGGDLGYAIMQPGVSAQNLNFTAQISYSNLFLAQGHFGLEMGWNLAGEPLDAQTGDNNAGVGIYAGIYHNFADPEASLRGFATAYYNEQTGAGGPIAGGNQAPLPLPDEFSGSLKLEKVGLQLTTSWAGADGVFNVLDVLDLGALGLAGDYITIGFSAGADANGFASVSFSDFEANPAPPAATPIPGAVWLLGSGLVGLVGLRKKYRS
jgi:hypothetical protein